MHAGPPRRCRRGGPRAGPLRSGAGRREEASAGDTITSNLNEATLDADRVYWSNANTKIVSDVPSEARLQPNLWGTFVFEPAR